MGFVGAGGVADRHAGVLAGFDDVELVAVTDVDGARAETFGRAHGIPAVPDIDTLLRAGLDAVYVCVPPFAHGAPEEAVLGAGLPMFVEKPPAADQAIAERIAKEVAASGVVTRVGLHWRCAEHVRQARDLLRGRTVRLVSAWWLDKVPPVAWWTDAARSGGPLVEQAVHVLDLVRVLVGEVAEVHAVSAGALGGATTDAATAGLLRFEDGPVGTVATSCVLTGKHRAGIEIVADGLVVAVGEDWLQVDDGTETRRTTHDPAAARIAADREFVDALGAVAAPTRADLTLPDHAEAMRSHRLACALARSAASGAAERVQ
jgi:myo-inositol 2-dehydrogenase / D-chiro-inositol 1-dehydrogenase